MIVLLIKLESYEKINEKMGGISYVGIRMPDGDCGLW